MKTLADTMKRLIGPTGIFTSNAAASMASQSVVSRSTFDRLRNGDRIGASAVAIDKLDGVADTFGVEVWQLFVPGMDPRCFVPRLAATDEVGASLSEDEKQLLNAYRALGAKEREYLLADAEKYRGRVGQPSVAAGLADLDVRKD